MSMVDERIGDRVNELPATVQEARAANGTALEQRTVCEMVWVTSVPGVFAGESLYRRTHSCIEPIDVGDGEHHWGLHQCSDHECGEATSIDVYDPQEGVGA